MLVRTPDVDSGIIDSVRMGPSGGVTVMSHLGRRIYPRVETRHFKIIGPRWFRVYVQDSEMRWEPIRLPEPWDNALTVTKQGAGDGLPIRILETTEAAMPIRWVTATEILMETPT